MSFFDSWPAIIGMKINEMWPYLALGKNFAHFWPFLVNFGAILAKFHFAITHSQMSVANNKFFSILFLSESLDFPYRAEKLCFLGLLVVFQKAFCKIYFPI